MAPGSVSLFGTPHRRLPRLAAHRVRPAALHRDQRRAVDGREVVASGRITRRRLLPAAQRADRRGHQPTPSTWSASPTGPSYGISQLSGRPAAARAHRAGAGRASPTCWCSTSRPPASTSPNQQALADALGVLKARGATIVLVAHELGPMEPLIDRAGGDARRAGRLLRAAARPERDGHDHHHHHERGSHDHVAARRLPVRRARRGEPDERLPRPLLAAASCSAP